LFPFNYGSGKLWCKRKMWSGEGPIRAVLYRGTLKATRFSHALKKFYGRLLVACLRKSLSVLNALMWDRTLSHPIHLHPL
jgi:hypothetical protein